MTDDESIRIQLARMEGKLDVSNERLNNVQIDVAGLREKVHHHGNELTKIQAERGVLLNDYHKRNASTDQRITILEDWRTDLDGQRKGVISSGRVIVWLGGLIPGGVIVGGLMRLFGS